MRPGPIDLLPAWLRHLLIALAPVLAAEVLHSAVPFLQERHAASALGGVLVTFLALACTTLTRQYGIGSGQTKES